MRAQSVIFFSISFLYPLSKHPAVLEGGQITVAQAVWIVELLVVCIDEDGAEAKQCVLGLRLWCRCVCGVWR